jgi:hypothetical protein
MTKQELAGAFEAHARVDIRRGCEAVWICLDDQVAIAGLNPSNPRANVIVFAIRLGGTRCCPASFLKS